MESRDAQNTLVDDGKYLVLWKKTDKGWKMFRDSFSSNRAK
jgi:ketosteroid isomerase-like protein